MERRANAHASREGALYHPMQDLWKAFSITRSDAQVGAAGASPRGFARRVLREFRGSVPNPAGLEPRG
jgi:hypothetical protein